LGCGKRYIPGYFHVDQSVFDHVDRVGPVDNLSWLHEGSVEEIYASHVFEYFDFEESKVVLSEWRRVLRLGGVLRLAVPDFDKLIEVYKHPQGSLPKIVGPLFGKWKLSVPSRDGLRLEEEIRYHKFVWNLPTIKSQLQESGFTDFETYNPFDFCRLIGDSYDDHSLAIFPPDSETPIQISLCVTARKGN